MIEIEIYKYAFGGAFNEFYFNVEITSIFGKFFRVQVNIPTKGYFIFVSFILFN